MRILGKSAYLGGMNSAPFQKENCIHCEIRYTCKYRKIANQLEKILELAKDSWSKIATFSKKINIHLKNHIFEKQDLYLPVLIAAVLLVLVFVSKTAFSKGPDQKNNLPVEDEYKTRLIGTNLKSQDGKICASGNEKYQKELKEYESSGGNKDLKEDVANIVKNTPMNAMVDSISEKHRTVAAFIVGIAMKESKFGIYSPKLAGRDCYNYWGFKGGGKTVAGGYTCFSSPEQAVDAVGGRIEKMVAKGVRTPAQAISWKCGSSCAGHGEASVRKWISDVALNFYKINS